MLGLCFFSSLSSSPALGSVPLGNARGSGAALLKGSSAGILWLRDAAALPLSDDSRGKTT